MEKRYIEWDRRYVLIIHMNELFEKSEEIVKEIGEEAYRILVEFTNKWNELVERDKRFGDILEFVISITLDGTVDWRRSFATVMYFPTPAPPITMSEMATSMAGHSISTVRSLFEPFFEPPEPITVYIMRFLEEGKGIVLP